MKEESEIEKPKEKYVLKEIATQTDTVIGMKDSDDVFTEKGILLEILNKLDRIEKAVV